MSGRLTEFLRRRNRRKQVLGATVVAFVAFTVVGVAAASARQQSHHPKTAKTASHHAVRTLASAIGNVGVAAGFEDNDGNLIANDGTPPLTDWNSLSTNWQGTAPYQNSTTSSGPFSLYAISDAVGSNDSTYGGGVKQADNCPKTVVGSAPNKDDLARIYIAGRVGGADPSNHDVYLFFAWVRAPQNTTSADAHVAFEFNQSTTPCANGDGLVPRTTGDVLIVYNFQSGSASLAVATWTGSTWGPETPLSSGVSEAAVYGGTGPTPDSLKPSGSPDPSTDEFGEAGIDLTQAVSAVSGGGARPCEHFGNVVGESRSSGSSTTASMEDLVGPQGINLSNCASPTITTQASPTTATLNTATSVTDTATLNGANSPTGNVTFTLYSDSACTTSTGVTGTGTISGSTASFTGSFKPTTAGTYYWQASYPGDGNNNAFTTGCTDANEQITVARVQPSATTQASPATALTAGTAATVGDTATISGAFNPTGSVTFTLYSNVGCTQSTGVTGGGLISAGTASYSSTFTPPTAGTYYWQASYPGDANNNAFTTPCNAANEELTAGKGSPTITTQANASGALAAGTSATVGDTATFHGGATPTGSVTFTLYSDNSCSTSTGVTGSGTIGSGTATFSTSWTPAAAGTFYWKAVYGGDSNNNGFTTGCGDANEQLSVGKAAPSATTQASPTTTLVIGTSATVGDTATIHNGVSPTGSVTFTLYSDSGCTAPVSGISGSGSITSGSATFSKSWTPSAIGTYYWKATYAGDANNNGFTTGCGDANEQLTVGKASPSATTQATPAGHLTAGTSATVGDTATIHNAFQPTGSVTFTLYSNSGCTTSTGVSGGGLISGGSATFSSTFTPPTAGTYYWQATYAGDTNNNGFTTGCSDANEQLTADKGSPTITTQANPTGSVVVGTSATVADTATISGGASPAGSIAFTLYSDSSCTTATSVTGSGPISGGSATFSKSWTPQAAGTYYWQASYAGDANNNPFTTGCRDANEQLVVDKASPSATTQATPTDPLPIDVASTVGDTATVNNGFNATGDVTFTLYSDNSCTTSTGVSGTGTITNGQASYSAQWTPTLAGTYYWQASYAGDANNNGFTTGCKDANEQLGVGKGSPSATTQASPITPLVIGTSATVGDTATITGGASPTGLVTFTLYSDDSCTTSTGVTGTGAISDGTASFSTTWTPATGGTFYWQASYAGDDNDFGFTTGCGDANEQLTVTKASPTLSTMASPDAPIVVGSQATVGDTATMIGGASPSGDVTFTLYSDSECTNAVEGVSVIATLADGTATFSTTWTPSATGTYYWQASYAGDDSNNAFTAPCAAANEQLTVVKTSPTISTILSQSTGFPGDTVNDTSSLSGLAPNAGGTVAYTVYSDSSCQTQVADGGTFQLNADGSVPDSNGVPFASTGTFYWQAVYSGDDNNQTATSACTDETLLIKPLGTIEIVKNTLGGDGTFDFTSTGGLPSPASGGDFSLTTSDGSVTQDFSVLPGDFTVAESVPGGWNLSGLSCTKPNEDGHNGGTVDSENSSQADINVASGGFVQCTFTNTKLATLIVKKVVDNSNGGGTKGPGDFSIHVTTAGLDLPNSPAPGSSTGTTYSDLLPGLYAVSEDAVSGYSLTSNTCAGGVNIDAGATVTCTLTNTSAAPPPPPPPPPPAPKVDLQITKTGTPNPATLGNTVTWSMVVSNNGPNGATGVTVGDPLPAGTTFVSVSTTQGTCTGGVLVSCQLGSMAVGSSVTITLVTTATTTGTVTNTATTVANEQETNTANNTASASVVVNGPLVPPTKPVKPPTYCTAVAVSPKSLFVGRTHILTVRVSQHGKAKSGVRVRIHGASLSLVTKPSNSKGLVKKSVKPTKAGIVVFVPVAQKSCKNPRIGVIGVFTPPVTG